uniref:Uncharacterized protein n=1 Tax=Arundo donax TaxID=35708 RepID=A0A0A9D6N6_ARUDO
MMYTARRNERFPVPCLAARNKKKLSTPVKCSLSRKNHGAENTTTQFTHCSTSSTNTSYWSANQPKPFLKLLQKKLTDGIAYCQTIFDLQTGHEIFMPSHLSMHSL